MNALVDFWRQYSNNGPPYVHQDDVPVFARFGIGWNGIRTFDQYVASEFFGNESGGSLDPSLVPEPFSGDLSTAEIFVLTLNPGLNVIDYYAELAREDIKALRLANLRQENVDWEFPYPWLNPQNCWHGGYTYFEGKLRSVVRRIADRFCGGSYVDALRYLSRRFATIELVPYHSTTFGAHKLAGALPSVAVAKRFVLEELVPRAMNGEITIVVTRQVASWGLQSAERIILYPPSLARGAHLGEDTPGGQAILRQLGLAGWTP